MKKFLLAVPFVAASWLLAAPAETSSIRPGTELGFYGNYAFPTGVLNDRYERGPGLGIKFGISYIIAGVDLSYTRLNLRGKADRPPDAVDVYNLSGYFPLFGDNRLRYFTYVSLGAGYYAQEKGGNGPGFNVGPGLMILLGKPKPTGRTYGYFLDAAGRLHVFRGDGDVNTLLEVRAGLTFFFD